MIDIGACFPAGLNPYVDSIVLYNRWEKDRGQKAYYYGTRIDNVQIELTKGSNIRESGLENADSCYVTIPESSYPKPFLSPKEWSKQSTEERLETFTADDGNRDFFVIAKKAELNLDISDLPVGEIDNKAPGYGLEGFFDHAKSKYGYAFLAHTVDVSKVIPFIRIGGS